MTDLCHGAKVVPNGEKYKNRFDMKKVPNKMQRLNFGSLPLPLKQRTQKAKKRRDPLRSQRFGTPAGAPNRGSGLGGSLYPTELDAYVKL